MLDVEHGSGGTAVTVILGVIVGEDTVFSFDTAVSS